MKLHRHCGVSDIVHSLFDGEALGLMACDEDRPGRLDSPDTTLPLRSDSCAPWSPSHPSRGPSAVVRGQRGSGSSSSSKPVSHACAGSVRMRQARSTGPAITFR